MKKSERNKLTTNEVYLEECMKILDYKIKAMGFNFHDSKGRVLPNNIVNIEGDEHGTITIVSKPNMKKIMLDGTNYSLTFYNSEDGKIIIRNNELNIEYVSADKELNDVIHEIKLIRKVGETVEYFRYLCCDGMCVVLEHYTKDEDSKTQVINNEVQNLNDDELLAYAVRAFDEYNESECDLSDENLIDNDIDEESLSVDMEEEVSAFVDDDFSDYCTIDYISSVFPINQGKDDKPHECSLQEDVTKFDYEEYKKNNKYDEHYHEEDEDELQVYYDGTQEGFEEGDDYSEEPDFDDEGNNFSTTDGNDIAQIAKQCISEEIGFIDPEAYSVSINDELIADEMIESDLVDRATIQTMDVNQELEDLIDTYTEIKSDFDKIKTIIIRRKKKMDDQGDTFGSKKSNSEKSSEEYEQEI